jgi:hypothetical protein
MEKVDSFVVVDQVQINNKIFFVPRFNLVSVEKYFLPKLDNSDMQHVYFNPKDIDQLYK